MLEWLGAVPESLVVLNHPMWDENHIGKEAHAESVDAFLHAWRPFIHALELNGLRPWDENQRAAQLAARFGLPVVIRGRPPRTRAERLRQPDQRKLIRQVRNRSAMRRVERRSPATAISRASQDADHREHVRHSQGRSAARKRLGSLERTRLLFNG
jgi:hypothetical protein